MKKREVKKTKTTKAGKEAKDKTKKPKGSRMNPNPIDHKEVEERKNPITVERLEDGTFVFHGSSLQIIKDKNRALEPYGHEVFCNAVKLAMLPTDEQSAQLSKTIGCARLVRNDYLAKRIELYKNEKKTLSSSSYKAHELKTLKAEKPFLCEVDKFALENSLIPVDRAYANFFEGRAGFPKFASKNKPSGNSYTTSFTNGNIKLYQEGDSFYVQLPKVGHVKVAMPKKTRITDLIPEGTRITGATVSRAAGRYYVSIHTEAVVPIKEGISHLNVGDIYGVDMGIKTFADIGSGASEETTKVENPKWLKKQARKIRRLQKALARKQYDKTTHTGSKNWKKAKAKLAKAQRKIADQRKDFQHKLSREIADNCKAFICEDLNIKGMVRNHKLAREISSAGWGQFLGMVKYKMERKDGIFIKIDTFFPSSKLCHVCGYKNEGLGLKDREWECPVCHTKHDRDDNAVQNILNEGIRLLKEHGIRIEGSQKAPEVVAV